MNFPTKHKKKLLRLRTHEQIKHALFAHISTQLLHTDRKFEQIKPPLIAKIIDPYEVTLGEFGQIKHALFTHVNAALT